MKFLVAYTGMTDLNKAVLDLAGKHSKLFNAELHIVNSKENPDKNEVIDFVEFQEGLRSLKESMTKDGIKCETHVMVTGHLPGDDIVEFARDNDIDQIYIGVERISRLGKLIFGSNAQTIILDAPCPVISVNREYYSKQKD
ncbi:MAG: universal stress protein [Spirochaetes bacterium]|nr:universal stress protein [Spirochaetota bacterium]